MLSLLLYGALTLLLVSVFVWAWQRSKTIGVHAKQREADALARVHAGKELFGNSLAQTPSEANANSTQGSESLFMGLPSEGVPMGQIDVADVTEAVDIERLLAGESFAVVERARARLEEPTNLSMDGDSLVPLGGAPNPLGDSWAARAAANAATQKAAERLAADRANAERLAAERAAAAQMEQRRKEQLEAQRLEVERVAAAQRFEEQRLAAQQAEQALLAQRQLQQAREREAEAAKSKVAPPVAAPVTQSPPLAPALVGPQAPERNLPLRELILAWFEARGYRTAPASSALRPIELVLRHKDDPARVYGFVVEDSHVTLERVKALRTQAKSVGLIRLLLVVNASAEPEVFEALRRKGVRAMDRAAIEQELAALDFSVAAKIMAVARQRAAMKNAAPNA